MSKLAHRHLNAPTPERARQSQLRVIPTSEAGAAAHHDGAPDVVGKLVVAGLITADGASAVLRLRDLAGVAGLAGRLVQSYEAKPPRHAWGTGEGEDDPAEIAEAAYRRRLRMAGPGSGEVEALAIYDAMPTTAAGLARLRAAIRRLPVG